MTVSEYAIIHSRSSNKAFRLRHTELSDDEILVNITTDEDD